MGQERGKPDRLQRLKAHAWFALLLSLEALFGAVDAFCRTLEPQWQQQLLGFGLQQRHRLRSLCECASMTSLLGLQPSCYRKCQTSYQARVQREWAAACPALVRYQRFIAWVPRTRTPVPKWQPPLVGNVFAAKGQVSQKLAQQRLQTAGIQRLTQRQRHRQQRLLPLGERLLRRKRALSETGIDPLKHIAQVEHSRDRAPRNGCVNVLGGLLASCQQPQKPSIALDHSLLLPA